MFEGTSVVLAQISWSRVQQLGTEVGFERSDVRVVVWTAVWVVALTSVAVNGTLSVVTWVVEIISVAVNDRFSVVTWVVKLTSVVVNKRLSVETSVVKIVIEIEIVVLCCRGITAFL
jgi:hypothetical protein